MFSSTYHNTLADLMFLRTVNLPNLSLLPSLEVASSAKVIFHQRSSSTYHNTLVDHTFVRALSITNPSLLPTTKLYYLQCMMHDAWCNTLVDLVFVRTVNIPNFSLLPCLEVAYIFFDELNIWNIRNKHTHVAISHIFRQHAALKQCNFHGCCLNWN